MSATKSAQAVRLVSGFGIDKLSLDPVEVPEPGPNEVLVRIRAVSLNYRDLLVTTGQVQPETTDAVDSLLGWVRAKWKRLVRRSPGSRPAIALRAPFFRTGPQATSREEAAPSALGGAIDGVFTSYRVFSEEGLVHIPEHLSFEEAATLPCAAVTAWNTLTEAAHLKAGETVLVLGTGGVSIFALQFAAMQGARVIVTSSSDEKLKRARELGAAETINYRSTPNWEAEVHRLTDKRGADVIVEVGGADTFPKSLRSLRLGGHIGVIGNLSGIETSIHLGYILRAQCADSRNLRRIAKNVRGYESRDLAAQDEARDRSRLRIRPLAFEAFEDHAARRTLRQDCHQGCLRTAVTST